MLLEGFRFTSYTGIEKMVVHSDIVGPGGLVIGCGNLGFE